MRPVIQIEQKKEAVAISMLDSITAITKSDIHRPEQN
jgi:hypothetical protein